jgi:hypothetical protein
MKPDRDVEEAEEEHVETQREGSAAGLVAGLLILGLLAGSVILVTYFWPVFEIAAPQPNVSTPAPTGE